MAGSSDGAAFWVFLVPMRLLIGQVGHVLTVLAVDAVGVV